MRHAVKTSMLATMAESLEPIELGAAVRILVRLMEKATPVPRKTIHLVAGVDKAAWAGMEAAVLAHFPHTDEQVMLGDAAHPISPIAGDAKPVRAGITPPLFPETPKGVPAPQNLPAYLAKRPKAVSLRTAIYDTGVRLLLQAGLTEAVARAVITAWLKDYNEGIVADALAAAQEHKDIVDVHSWIAARLRAAGRGIRMHPGLANPAPRLPRAKGDPMSGMSEQGLASVLERNRRLRATNLSDIQGLDHIPSTTGKDGVQ